MATTAVTTPLHTVATEKLRNQVWFKHVADENCLVVDYAFGEEIKLDPERNTLGIVVAGSAEICDESRLGTKYLAYRPIRVIGEGEFFGDFPIADFVLKVGANRPQTGASEKWKLYAGRRSVLILEKVKRVSRFSDPDQPDLRSPHLFVNKAATNLDEAATPGPNPVKAPTPPGSGAVLATKPSMAPKALGARIALVQRDELFVREGSFFHEILCAAWEKAYAYRAGLNSYNLSDLFVFRRIVAREWDGESSRVDEAEKPKLIHPIGRIKQKTLQSIFADALFDALHRPIRGEPVFVYSKEALPPHCNEALEKEVNNIGSVLTAGLAPREAGVSFYYPIDLYNLEINSYCVQHELQEDAKEALGWERDKNPDKRTPRNFFKILTERVLKKYCGKEENANYPYVVACRDEPCLDGRILILEFQCRRADGG